MRLGFTGTQRGMTEAQWYDVWHQLEAGTSKPIRIREAHHGDCIGADADFDELCDDFGIQTVIHPPNISTKRAWCSQQWALANAQRRQVGELPPLPYLERNHAIVDRCTLLIATPGEMTEQLRSGTWATIRYARRLGRPLRIVFPDGSVTQERVP